MRNVNLGKALRLAVTTAIALGTVTASVFAATIETNGRVTGSWSDPSIWKGSVVPGASDDAIVVWMPAPASKITYDPAASGTVGSISANQLILTLARDLRVQNLYLRECTILDGGHNATISGTLSNYLIDGYEGNGGIRTGQGGNLFIANLTLGRTGLYTFYPGDTISGNYTTRRIRNTWPDITVTQNPEFYGNRLDRGLSFENEASGAISLGSTSATDQAEITLSWDTGFSGPIDWTLRWKGDHVATLRDYHAKGQIKISKEQQPAGMTFNPADNIFFDAATGYTYVGFKGVTRYDVAAQFSLSSNPNGVWTYGWSAAPGGALTRFSKSATGPLEPGADAVSYWNTGAPSWDAYHAVFANQTTTPRTVSQGLVVGPWALVLHPANDGKLAVARFTARTDGQYAVWAAFKNLDAQAKKTQALVAHGGVTLHQQILTGANAANTNSWTVILRSGETIDFAVGNGGDGFADDSVQLTATVVRTDAPSSP